MENKSEKQIISYNTIFAWLNYILQHEGTTNIKYEIEQFIPHKNCFIHSFAFHYVFQLFAQDLVVLAFCVHKVLLKAQIVSIGMPVVFW
jgi:hypothetical protein